MPQYPARRLLTNRMLGFEFVTVLLNGDDIVDTRVINAAFPPDGCAIFNLGRLIKSYPLESPLRMNEGNPTIKRDKKFMAIFNGLGFWWNVFLNIFAPKEGDFF